MVRKLAYGLKELGVKRNKAEYEGYSNERLKEFRKQREQFGFDDRELYDLPYTFALFIYPRLKKMADSEINSTPIRHNDLPLLSGNQAHAVVNSDCLNPDGLTIREWKEILDKMLYSFRYVIEEGNNGSREMEKINERLDSKDERVREEAFKQETEILIAVDEGFKLFAEYYLDLWD